MENKKLDVIYAVSLNVLIDSLNYLGVSRENLVTIMHINEDNRYAAIFYF